MTEKQQEAAAQLARLKEADRDGRQFFGAVATGVGFFNPLLGLAVQAGGEALIMSGHTGEMGQIQRTLEAIVRGEDLDIPPDRPMSPYRHR